MRSGRRVIGRWSVDNASQILLSILGGLVGIAVGLILVSFETTCEPIMRFLDNTLGRLLDKLGL